MVRQIVTAKNQDIKLAEDKRLRNLKMIAEVEAANKVALAKKAEHREQLNEEDMNVARYN